MSFFKYISQLDRSLPSFGFIGKKRSLPTPRTRSYAGARSSRLDMDWMAGSTSADAELSTALRKLRNRSREQLRNNDYARGAIATIVNNVVGGGIKFQAQVGSGKGYSDRRNELIEALFDKWSKKANCDIANRLSFCQFQRLALRSMIESGEVFIRKHYRGGLLPFSLELIESDRIEDQYGYSPSVSGNIVKMGIEFDSYGKVIAYYLRSFHPGDTLFHPKAIGSKSPYGLERVPADQIIHLFIPERPGQSRGVPWLSSSLQRLKNLGGYEEAELVAARASAAVMRFRITKDPDLTELDDRGQPVDTLEPGTIKELAPGEEFVGFDPTRPNDAFEPFIRMMLRGVAANLGIDFESVSRDFSQSNYSSSRLALIQVRDSYKSLQDFFIEDFLQPIFEDWLNIAVLNGSLSFPDYERNPDRYTKVRWRPRGWSWVDPWKETQASIEAINAGLSTLTQELAKQGLDIEEVLTERATELELARSLGLVLTDSEQAPAGDAQFSEWMTVVNDPFEDEEDELDD